ncbi:MAG: outer membrane lipoprotein carrier protein LolA [Candidatus Cryptobacteroides sp.]
MKRLSFIISLLCIAFSSAFAQTDYLRTFVDNASSSRMVFDYTYKAESRGVPVSGSGTATVQDGCFILSGDGLEIYCDGKERWTVDTQAREVVIEPVQDASDIVFNPAVLSSSLADSFTWNPSGKSASFDGKSVISYSLTPADKSAAIKYLTVYMNKSVPAGMQVLLSDGTKTNVSIVSFSAVSKGSLSDFAPSENAFDSSYVITDLR